MAFLQHFLPGKPLEENGHWSAGFVSSVSLERGSTTWMAGLDADWSDVFLKQTQDGPTEGSDFLQETRPEGKHYDYDVDGATLAPWILADMQLAERWALNLGLRAEYARYDYRNNMLTGNTRDDGTTCGFGGCLYSRPANRSDSYSNLAPKAGLRYQANERTTLFTSLARGFRAPQQTELYRLQNGQSVADLESERVDSLELGVRTGNKQLLTEIVVFAMQKARQRAA